MSSSYCRKRTKVVHFKNIHNCQAVGCSGIVSGYFIANTLRVCECASGKLRILVNILCSYWTCWLNFILGHPV